MWYGDLISGSWGTASSLDLRQCCNFEKVYVNAHIIMAGKSTGENVKGVGHRVSRSLWVKAL